MPMFSFEGRFPTVHPTAWIAPTATLVGDVTVEAGASVWYGAVLRADFGPIVVRAGANVQDGSVLHGGTDPVTEIGAGATVGHLCVVHGAVVGEQALIGNGSAVQDGARIGARALVAAGSTVTPGTVVEPETVATGTPARARGPLGGSARWWVENNPSAYAALAERHRAGVVPVGGPAEHPVAGPAARSERWFEDYVVGTTSEFGPVHVTEDEVVEFGQRFDPQPFHVDAQAAAAGPFGGLIASGWHTCALMMRLLADQYLSPVSSLGSPGVDELRWLRPVRPGAELVLRTTVEQARPSTSKPDRGIVRTRIAMVDQDGEPVLTLLATNLVLRRP